MAEMKSLTYNVPGEHWINGIMFHGSVKRDAVINIRDEMCFDENDTLLVTYPKSGTTWVQSILYLLNSYNDIETGAFSSNPFRFAPYIEKYGLEQIQQSPSPRYMKSHLPYSFFKRALDETLQVKTVVVMRNPKDTFVSLYHFYRMNTGLGNFTGTWEDFFQMVIKGQVIYGDWFDFTRGWWATRSKETTLILFYEDIKADPVGEIKKLADFIGKSPSEKDIKKIVEMSSFGNLGGEMSKHVGSVGAFREEISPFMRKGEVGDWKNYFTVHQSEECDRLCKEYFAENGPRFTYE